jgi:hypothetical protein
MPTSGVIRYTRLPRPASPSARFAADWAINPSFHLGGGAGANRLRKPVSVTYRTGLGYAETEIGKWRAETGTAKPPIQRRNSRICQPETPARQPNPRECRRFSHTGKSIAETALAGWGWRIRTSTCGCLRWERRQDRLNSMLLRLRPALFSSLAHRARHHARPLQSSAARS